MNPEDPVARAMAKRTREALAEIPGSLKRLPRSHVPMAAQGLTGVTALRAMLRGEQPEGVPATTAVQGQEAPDCPPLAALVDELAHAGRGVILTMGKGGVGKTTVASAIAVALAERGLPVHLTTTDPAAHVAATVNGKLPNLRVSRIDPRAETAAYTAEVMTSAGAELDEQGKALLAEDLRSPCTEE